MATNNSTTLQNVYGTDTDLGTKVAGGAFFASENSADVKVAQFAYTAVADSDGGNTINLTQLPKGAKVLWVSIDTGSALMASSGTLTISYDGTQVGTALNINNTAGAFTTGIGDAVVSSSSDVGLVSGEYSAHQVNAVAVTGNVYYYLDN